MFNRKDFSMEKENFIIIDKTCKVEKPPWLFKIEFKFLDSDMF